MQDGISNDNTELAHANPYKESVEPQIHPPNAVYTLPRSLKIKLLLSGIGLSIAFFFIGIFFTILMINIPFDSGPLNAIQRPVLSAANIPIDAHRQWLDLAQAFSLVDRYYFEPDKVNHKEMTYAAAQSALSYLGDPYTQFVPPERSKQLAANLTGQRVGIGINTLYKPDKSILIKDVFEGTPADKAGVKEGDIIQKINGEPLIITGDANKDLTSLADRLRGDKNTKVTITVMRPAENNRILDIEITRNDYILPSVTVKMLPDKVGYVAVNVFGETTVKEFDEKVKRLTDAGAVGLVLDLRGNGGGLVDTAQGLLSRFLKGGVAYYADIPAEGIKFRTENVAENNGGIQLYDIPLAVLVNKDSASASEITAGALRDRDRAALIGEKTYGKAVGQYVLKLTDGSTARITFEKWYTPRKIDINKQGLQPNITVDTTQDDINAGRDPQLDRAVKFVLQKEPIPALAK